MACHSSTTRPSLLATANCAQKECAIEPSEFLIFGGSMQHNMVNVIDSIIKRVGENVPCFTKLGST